MAMGFTSVGYVCTFPSANFTRPADTTAYTTGDLVANSTTAASVVPMSWSLAAFSGASFNICGITLKKSTGVITSAQFKIHLYNAAPVVSTTGDNGVYVTDVAGNANWLGEFSGTMTASHSDGASVLCLPTQAYPLPAFVSGGGTVYGLIEARAGYTPGNAEVFTAIPLVEQNLV